METLTTPRVMLSGIREGAGKKLLATGLIHELRRRGISISCVVRDSCLLQTAVFRRLAGRYCICLDSHLLDDSQMLYQSYMAGVGADLILVTGKGGLYDGNSPGDLKGSDAELAELTLTPIILLVDGQGWGNSLVALIKGYFDYGEGLKFIGACLNKLKRDNQGCPTPSIDFFNRCLKEASLGELIGAVPAVSLEADLPPADVCQSKVFTSLPRSFFVELGNLVNKFIDIDLLIERAETASSLRLENLTYSPLPRRTRIAVSDDSCFNICFQDNLVLLKYFGAEIVPFSPLADQKIPAGSAGVYLTGGALGEYATAISNNDLMLKAIREFANSGGVIFSEGAASALLCDKYIINGDQYPGVGVIPAAATLKQPKQSYFESITMEDSILGPPGLVLRGIDTREFSLSGPDRAVMVLQMKYPDGEKHFGGFSPGAQIVSSFGFCHMGSNPVVARHLVDACEVNSKLG
ncbi:MAG: hypothetical protein D6719_09870 [Candidatus Dadabacteria bacterium]|nr:MAG: hypothetical protein D6719_09870 [Candidatus Dadabacteria bacterium]